MSTVDTDEGDRFPEFELNYLFDDADNPTEVTVFPGNEDEKLSERWISVDVTHAVALEDSR